MVFNDSKSYTKDLSCGVPQGSVLGPLLFLIYMNDMPNCLMTSHAILFADDTTLVASSRDPMQLYHDMNLDLDRLCNWFRSNKLSLNTSKTHYMEFFSLQNNTQCVKLEINDEVLVRKSTCKFLGVVLDERLTWSEHIKHIHSKLSGSLYALNRSKNFVPTKSLNTLYHSLVHTHLTYGDLLWGGTFTSHLKRITTCQKKAVRIIHNKPYNYHTSQLFKQSNILKFNDLYEYEVCRHIHDSIGGRIPKPLLKVYSPNFTIHSYNTRQRNYPHTASRGNIIIAKQITHQGIGIWSRQSQNIRNIAPRTHLKEN